MKISKVINIIGFILVSFSFGCGSLAGFGDGEATGGSSEGLEQKTSLTSSIKVDDEENAIVQLNQITDQTLLDYFDKISKRPVPPISFIENPARFDGKEGADLVLEVEKTVREIIPYATNQMSDLVQSPLGFLKYWTRKKIEKEQGYFWGILSEGKPVIASELVYSWYFQTGVCDDYQCLTEHILFSINHGKPIYCVEVYKPFMHKFCLLGDPEESDCYVVDPWTTERNVVLFSESEFFEEGTECDIYLMEEDLDTTRKDSNDEIKRTISMVGGSLSEMKTSFNEEKRKKVLLEHSTILSTLVGYLTKYKNGERRSEEFPEYFCCETSKIKK